MKQEKALFTKCIISPCRSEDGVCCAQRYLLRRLKRRRNSRRCRPRCRRQAAKELCETVAGLMHAEKGAILYKKENIVGKSPREIIKMGISMSFIPEDRLGTGLDCLHRV
ncbi:MAG: hypothetical protein ACLTB5_16000 [Acutalibacteraceae bacterium]